MDSPRSDVSMRSLSNSQSSLSTTSCSSTFTTPTQTPRPVREEDKINDYETLLIAIDFLDVTLRPLLKNTVHNLPKHHQYDEIVKNCMLRKPLVNTKKEIEILLESVKQISLALETVYDHVNEEYKKTKSLYEEKLSKDHDIEASDLCTAYLERRKEPQKKFEEVRVVYRKVKKSNSENDAELSLTKKLSLKLSGEKFKSLEASYQNAVNELACVDRDYQKDTRALVEKYDKLLKSKRAPLKEATQQTTTLLKEIIEHFDEIALAAMEVLKGHNKVNS